MAIEWNGVYERGPAIKKPQQQLSFAGTALHKIGQFCSAYNRAFNWNGSYERGPTAAEPVAHFCRHWSAPSGISLALSCSISWSGLQVRQVDCQRGQMRGHHHSTISGDLSASKVATKAHKRKIFLHSQLYWRGQWEGSLGSRAIPTHSTLPVAQCPLSCAG